MSASRSRPTWRCDTEDTVAEARRLWKAVGRENLMVKVPGTEAGVPAIRTLITEGLNINVTLLFAQSAYEAVAEAFIAGLEDAARQGRQSVRRDRQRRQLLRQPHRQRDRQEDRREGEGRRAPGAQHLRGKVAIANAKLAYQHYLELFASPRWQELAAAGAHAAAAALGQHRGRRTRRTATSCTSRS